jgi:hypothetical protein
MATAAAHAQQATHNQNFLGTIDPNLFPDWIVTVAFYKAVHVVEGLLVRKGKGTGNHAQRNLALKTQFASVWKDYHPLYNQSRVARYWCVPFKPVDVGQAITRLQHVEASVAAIP